MKLCSGHWETLSAELHLRGVGPFNSSPAPIGLNLSSPANTALSKSDVMMSANLLIMKSALCAEGIRMINRQCCPVCELKVDSWLPLVADRLAEQINHPLTQPNYAERISCDD